MGSNLWRYFTGVLDRVQVFTTDLMQPIPEVGPYKLNPVDPQA
jgi:hypothetical protein